MQTGAKRGQTWREHSTHTRPPPIPNARPQTVGNKKKPAPPSAPQTGSPRPDHAPATADGAAADAACSTSGRDPEPEQEPAAAALAVPNAVATAPAPQERKAPNLYSSLYVSLLLAFTPSIQVRPLSGGGRCHYAAAAPCLPARLPCPACRAAP